MLLRSDRFYNNSLYRFLSNQLNYSKNFLQQFNALLHEEPDLVEITHPNEGSYFHIICRNSSSEENIAFRMIYALSNAGADPNVTDAKGNTPLHEAIIRGFGEHGLDSIQALFRVGVDPRIVNHEGKTADAYIKNIIQLTPLYKGYGEGIWNAIETSNIEETERLLNGFIKVDCKHNSNKTLLDKARDLECTSIIHMLADYQVTIEFVHSILACDWDRAALIYKHENEFFKTNPSDSIHRLTQVRTCSKSLLEYCLQTHCSEPFEILFNSPLIKIDVNILCTDGLPFFFHCFDGMFSPEARKNILFNSNMYMKSSKGETFLFQLIHLYILNGNNEHLKIFTNILQRNPLIITQRNEQEQTIIEVIEFSTSIQVYDKLRPFHDAIKKILVLQLKNNSLIEHMILNSFGYNLLIFCKNQTLLMTKHVYKLLRSMKFRKGLSILISSLFEAVKKNDLVELKNILKMKSNIYIAKDSFGRTCAHLAVIYQRYDILKFLCKKYNILIDTRDNLNRTSFHYACIMNDATSIEILEQAKAKQFIDCLNFYPTDYLLNHKLCFEEFDTEDFVKNESQRKSSAISNYLKIVFYPNLKKAIATDSIEDIKLLNNYLIKMGFDLKDFNPNSNLNDYVHGERYIPFLFLALEHRSIASIKYLIGLGLPLNGQMYMLKFKMNENSQWISIRSRAEELQCLNLIDVINDHDLKDAFTPKSVATDTIPDENPIKTEQQNHSNPDNLSIRQKLKNFFTRDQNSKSRTCVML